MKTTMFPVLLAMVAGSALADMATFEGLDTDEDEYISRLEAAQLPWLQFDIVDANRDSYLDPEEFEGAVSASFSALDTDRDDYISDVEGAAFDWFDLGAMDTNLDARIDHAEFEAGIGR